MTMINLDDVTEAGEVHNLAGRPRGENARLHFELDRLDSAPGEVIVEVPSHLINISSSFFLGMFSRSIDRLGGKDGFLRKYVFRASDHIMKCIVHGIDRATASRAPLRPTPRKRLFA